MKRGSISYPLLLNLLMDPKLIVLVSNKEAKRGRKDFELHYLLERPLICLFVLFVLRTTIPLFICTIPKYVNATHISEGVKKIVPNRI